MSSATRAEIADHVEAAFDYGSASKDELLESARASQARPEVLAALERLPERSYSTLRALWPELEDVPVGV